MVTKTLTHFANMSVENQTLLDNYIIQQMSAGTTDGIRTTVIRTGVSGDLSQREWTTADAATAFVTFCNSINPPPTYAVVVS